MQFKNRKEIENIYMYELGLSKQEITQLICQVLNIDFTTFCNTKEFNFTQRNKLKRVYKLMKKSAPLNKILHKSYFFGKIFYVNKHVLAPRPETELVCEKAIKEINNLQLKQCKVLDLCCGSGVIGISIKTQLPFVDVCCADISAKALRVAKKNSKINNAIINFVKSNMLQNINGKYDFIVCNPPYISEKEYNGLDEQVKNFDPKSALVGGEDGLDFYREIADTCIKNLNKNACIVFEIGYNQGESVKNIFQNIFEEIEVYKDYDNNDRIVFLKGVKNVR